MNDLDMVRAGVYRPVCKKRARKLRKRGEFVAWNDELHSYYWEPDWLTYHPKTQDGLPWLTHTEYLQCIGEA